MSTEPHFACALCGQECEWGEIRYLPGKLHIDGDGVPRDSGTNYCLSCYENLTKM